MRTEADPDICSGAVDAYASSTSGRREGRCSLGHKGFKRYRQRAVRGVAVVCSPSRNQPGSALKREAKLGATALSVLLILAGCGGGGVGGGSSISSGTHTYILGFPMLEGFDLTVVSPVAIPTNAFTGMKVVGRAVGPPKCSLVRTVHGLRGRSAILNGQTLTLKVNGSGPLASVLCSHLKTVPFNPSNIRG